MFCIECAGEVPANARFCNRCGIDRRKSLPTLHEEMDREPKFGPFCPTCGQRSPEDSAHCMWCGWSLAQKPGGEGFHCPGNECNRYQSGFHRGMNDTPEKVIQSLNEDIEGFEDYFDYIFAVTDTSQFYCNLTVLIRKKQE